MSLILVGEPTAEPITTAEAKTHMRVTDTAEDAYIDGLIKAARQLVERILGRAIMTQTWDMFLSHFPVYTDSDDNLTALSYRPIIFPYPPLASIDYVKYKDHDDVLQTWASVNYVVDTQQQYNGMMYPVRGGAYPLSQFYPKAVNIRFTAGYADAASVPQPIKQAISLLVAHMHENREATSFGVQMSKMPFAVDAMLAPYKLMNV